MTSRLSPGLPYRLHSTQPTSLSPWWSISISVARDCRRNRTRHRHPKNPTLMAAIRGTTALITTVLETVSVNYMAALLPHCDRKPTQVGVCHQPNLPT